MSDHTTSPTGPSPQTRPPNATVVVIIKDQSGAEQYNPYTQTCASKPDDVKGGRLGCGGTLFFYFTKNLKPMPFDKEAVLVRPAYHLDNLPYLFAEVENWNHFMTCPHGAENDRRRREWLKSQPKPQGGRR